MDAPTSFFFNLERKAGQNKQSFLFGQDTTNPAEMQRMAVRFHTEVYGAEGSHSQCTAELPQELLSLSEEQEDTLDSGFTLEEVAVAVQQLMGSPQNSIKGFGGWRGQTSMRCCRNGCR